MYQLAIVIVNYKSWQPLAANLTALLQVKPTALALQIVVVDNRSGDGQLAIFQERFPTVQFIENSGNWGFAHGCNVGAAASTAPYLLFLNPDAVASEAALVALVQWLEQNPQTGIVSCRQSAKATAHQKFFPRWFTLTGPLRSLTKLLAQRKVAAMTCHGQAVALPDWVSGSVVAMRRTWFEEVGGWNEAYWLYFEDVDLCKRVADSGGRIELLCGAYIDHQHGGASRINVVTSALTKTEVLISQHVYVQQHLRGAERWISQFFMVANNLVFKTILGIIGLLFFFIPKLRVQALIARNLYQYYVQAARRGKWLSPRSPQNT